MQSYSKERKASMLVRMLPPQNASVVVLSEQTGIPEQTLYNWRKKARIEGNIMHQNIKKVKDWTSAQKFEVVLETGKLNEIELNEYCRKTGLYPEQIAQWKKVCIDANATNLELNKFDKKRAREDKKKINNLQRELTRKEKALAEAAALLVLKKKAQNLWGDLEED